MSSFVSAASDNLIMERDQLKSVESKTSTDGCLLTHAVSPGNYDIACFLRFYDF